MQTPKFTSIQEEASYWKHKCQSILNEKDAVSKEFEEYLAESKQLEAEYETMLKQNEREMTKLNVRVEQQRLENDSLQKKLQTSLFELSEKDDESGKLKNETISLKKYITQLEQKNDDLERANRIVTESVSSFEASLNQAYEKNALLESEVDEKEKLQIKLQRLMDEARDLKQELKVREITKVDDEGNSPTPPSTAMVTTNITTENNSALGFPQNGHHEPASTAIDVNRNNGNAIASSTRVTAISIIYDLLRRIDRIESKLADWKKISAAASASNTTSDFSSLDKYNEKQ